MARQAKIKLGLDIKPLKEATAEAKKALEDIGNVKLDKSIKKAFNKQALKDMTHQATLYRSIISDATKELTSMGKSSEKAWDHKRAQKLVETIRQTKNELRDLSRMQRSMSPVGGIMGGIGGLGGGMGRVSGMNPRAIGGRFLGGLGLSLGVGMAIHRSLGQATQSMALRELTGGTTVGTGSQFGFTRSERRARGLEVARGMGRNVTGAELTGQVNLGEALQRSFGISGGSFGAAIGAARKAGVKNQGEFVADAVGDAVADGITGSAVGEYLSSMTSYLATMSKGVDIDDKSLRGFAGALGDMDFFKRSPERIFDTIQNLGKTFSGGGNQFQQFLSYRAFQGASGVGGADSASAFRVRQNLGLFGGNKGLAEKFNKLGMKDVAKTISTGGATIINEMLKTAFKDAVAGGNGKSATSLAIFQETTGLHGQSGPEIFAKLMGQKQRTGRVRGLASGDIKKFKDAMLSPQQRAEKNMKSFDGSVLKFGQRVDDIQNLISDNLTSAVTKFVGAVDKFADMAGIHDDLTKLIAVLAGGKAVGLLSKGFRGGGGLGGPGGAILGGGGVKNTLGTLIGVAGAFELGREFGKGARDILNKWTDNEFENSLDKFWSKITGGFDFSNEEKFRNFTTDKGPSLIREARKQGMIGEKGVLSQNKMRDIFNFSRGQDEDISNAALLKMYQTEEKRKLTGIQDKKNRAMIENMVGIVSDTGDDDVSNAVDEFSEGHTPTFQTGGSVMSRRNRDKRSDAAAKFFRNKGRGNSKLSKIWDAIKKSFGGEDLLRTGPQRAARKMRGHQAGGAIDSVNIKASDGEFIVNREDTSRNLGALIHANNGGLIQPIGASAMSSSMPTDMPSGGPLPDVQSNTDAMDANTQAIIQLAQALSGMGRNEPQRGFPRGPSSRLGKAL